MRKIVVTLALVLGLGGLGTVAPVRAEVSPSVDRSIHPAAGHYRGRDAQDRLITFTYSRAHGIRNFRINHHLVGRATVSRGSWDRTCRRGFCVWGQWVSDTHVTGQWLRRPSTGSGQQRSEPVSFGMWKTV